MFSKVKLISLVLCLSFMFLGVGYAAWGQTNVVRANIKTGKYSVKVKYDSITPDDYVDVSVEGDPLPGDEINNLRFDIDGMYPGHGATVKSSVLNHSTMKVKLTSLQVEQLNGLTDEEREKIKMHVEIGTKSMETDLLNAQTDIDTLLGMITPTLEPEEESPMITVHIYMDPDETMIENKDASFRLLALTEQF